MEKNVEEQLIIIWKGIIHSNEINPNDNFMDQGGNSLHFIKLASLASKRFNIPVAPIDIFQAESISRLASVIKKKQNM